MRGGETLPVFLKEEGNMARKKKETTTEEVNQQALFENAAPVAETPAPETPAPIPPAPQVQVAPSQTMPPAAPKASQTGFKWFATLMIVLLLAANAFSAYKIHQLEKMVVHDSKIYVYSMENVLLLAGMADENKQHQIELDKLEKEIDAAQKKLNGIKDKKLKQEYSEVYMKSLSLKRDTLVETHEKFMSNLLKNVNRALLAVTEKYKAPTIFAAKSIAVHTPNVVDVTDEISKYLKDTM